MEFASEIAASIVSFIGFRQATYLVNVTSGPK